MTAKATPVTGLSVSKLKKQFSLRSSEFNSSANWITDKELIKAHLSLAGEPLGQALELCCGTGQVGGALKACGWDILGLDICNDMLRISSRHFPTFQAAAEKLPFVSNCFHLVTCRQSFQFLNVEEVLSEVARVLTPSGIFVVSLTVPFSEKDQAWLYKIHRVKQPLLKTFYTAQGLIDELLNAGFQIKKTKTLKIQESITRWMQYAPELNHDVRQKVVSMVKDAPLEYKQLHKVKVINREVFEDWNWVVIKAQYNL